MLKSSLISQLLKISALTLLFPLVALAMPINQTDKTNNANKPVMISPNQDTLELNLTANPSTGYGWYLKQSNNHFFKLTNYQFIPGNPQMPGAPGKAVFTFQVQPCFHNAPYLTQITLSYMRPWDLSTEIDRTVTLVSIPGPASAAASTQTPAASPPSSISSAPSAAPVTSTTVSTTATPATTSTDSSTTQNTWLSIPADAS